MSATVDAEKITKGLGQEWETMIVGFKPFSSVASIHSALDALRQIMQQNKLTAEDIAKVHVGLSTMTHVHCAWSTKRRA